MQVVGNNPYWKSQIEVLSNGMTFRMKTRQNMNTHQNIFRIWLLWLTVPGMVILAFHANGQASFAFTNPLNIPRAQHTATLLPDGEVLVAGGTGTNSDQSAISSVELYDPARGTWTVTNSMNNARFFQTATLLPDGQVLIAGGGDNELTDNPIPTAELFNPVTRMWAFTGSPNFGRVNHTATLLTNGMVLIAGGLGTNALYCLSSAELYNPATGKWTVTGSMSTGRDGHSAALLPDGKVLVVGGYVGNGGSQLSSAELYDPASGTWTNTGSLNVARSGGVATLLPNGKVLIEGGYGNTTTSLSSAELYNPATGTWTNTGALNIGRSAHSATLLPNGKVLVAGGWGTNGPLSSSELYDPATGLWTTTSQMTISHWDHTATLLPDGKVLVAGGINDRIISNSELYDAPLGYLQISGQLVDSTNMQLSFFGFADANYALDRSLGLTRPNWTPQTTNTADSTGALVFTNAPDVKTNNFWRVRSVP